VTKWLGYNETDILGKPLFEFQHGVDAPNIAMQFKNCKFILAFVDA
jgi:hypothetical protein